MDPWHDLKTWSKQRREEALQEAREHYLAHPGRGERRARLGGRALASAWSGTLTVTHYH